MRKVTSPDGRTWKVGRRWFPGRRRVWRPRMRDMGDGSWADFGDDLGIIGAIVLAVVALVLIAFLALVLLNVVALAIELLIIAILVIGGIVGRVVFRRPWIVVAKSGDDVHQTPVVGWRASGRMIDDVAGRIASGQLQPPPGDRR